MPTDSDILEKVKNLLHTFEWTDPDDPDEEIQHFDILPIQEVDIDSQDKGFFVMTPDRDTFRIIVEKVMQ